MRDKNVLQLWTIFVACCSRTASDRISHFVALFMWSQVSRKWHILVSLSSERRASILTVSMAIPKMKVMWLVLSPFLPQVGHPNASEYKPFLQCPSFVGMCAKKGGGTF